MGQRGNFDGIGLRSLGVNSGEEGLVGALLLHSALIGCVLILTLTSANALFLSRIGAQGIPSVYLLVAVAAHACFDQAGFAWPEGFDLIPCTQLVPGGISATI